MYHGYHKICRSTFIRLTSGSSLTRDQASDEHRDNSFDQNCNVYTHVFIYLILHDGYNYEGLTLPPGEYICEIHIDDGNGCPKLELLYSIDGINKEGICGHYHYGAEAAAYTRNADCVYDFTCYLNKFNQLRHAISYKNTKVQKAIMVNTDNVDDSKLDEQMKKSKIIYYDKTTDIDDNLYKKYIDQIPESLQHFFTDIYSKKQSGFIRTYLWEKSNFPDELCQDSKQYFNKNVPFIYAPILQSKKMEFHNYLNPNKKEIIKLDKDNIINLIESTNGIDILYIDYTELKRDDNTIALIKYETSKNIYGYRTELIDITKNKLEKILDDDYDLTNYSKTLHLKVKIQIPSNKLLEKMKNEMGYGKHDLRKLHFKYLNKIISSRKWPTKLGASLNKPGGYWMNERILIDLCVEENGMKIIKPMFGIQNNKSVIELDKATNLPIHFLTTIYNIIKKLTHNKTTQWKKLECSKYSQLRLKGLPILPIKFDNDSLTVWFNTHINPQNVESDVVDTTQQDDVQIDDDVQSNDVQIDDDVQSNDVQIDDIYISVDEESDDYISAVELDISNNDGDEILVNRGPKTDTYLDKQGYLKSLDYVKNNAKDEIKHIFEKYEQKHIEKLLNEQASNTGHAGVINKLIKSLSSEQKHYLYIDEINLKYNYSNDKIVGVPNLLKLRI